MDFRQELSGFGSIKSNGKEVTYLAYTDCKAKVEISLYPDRYEKYTISFVDNPEVYGGREVVYTLVESRPVSVDFSALDWDSLYEPTGGRRIAELIHKVIS